MCPHGFIVGGVNHFANGQAASEVVWSQTIPNETLSLGFGQFNVMTLLGTLTIFKFANLYRSGD